MIRAKYVVMVFGSAMLLLLGCKKVPGIDMRFVSPVDGQRLTPGVIPIKVWAVGDTGTIVLTQLYVDGLLKDSTRTADSDTWRLNWDASLASPGRTHVLKAVAEARSFSNLKEIEVMIDTGGPWVKMLSPQDGDSFGRGLVQVTVRARDSVGNGMDKVEFYIDDVLAGTVTASAGDTYRWTWNDSQATAGGHSLKAKAYNQHGDKAVDGITVWVKGGGSPHGPTFHFGPIEADETWSPDGNPHVVLNVTVRNNALLTIMPGCTVKVKNGWGIMVGEGGAGGLSAIGTLSEPILFTSDTTPPHPGDWPGIILDTGTTASTQLRFCTFEYGYSWDVHVRGNTAATMEDCTIRGSAGAGVFCESGWFSSFAGNTVTGNATYPISFSRDLVGAVNETNTLTGNGADAIYIQGGYLRTDATWPKQNLPYILDGEVTLDGDPPPVLHIETGSTCWFRSGCGLYANHGDIEANEVTFEPDSGKDVDGEFSGISIGSGDAEDTISGTSLINCGINHGGNPDSPTRTGDVRVNNTRPTISNCDLSNGVGCGIVLFGQQVPDTAELRSGNSFSGNEWDIKRYP